MSAPSLRKAIDAKCRECGACGVGANWREHITCCPVTDCPLWHVRPLSKRMPSWLTRRSVETLPGTWRSLSMNDALKLIRNARVGAHQDSETLSCGGPVSSFGASGPNGPGERADSRGDVLRGGAP